MRMFIPARWSMRLTHGASTHPVSPATPGIVKTDYGYHIMYFSSTSEHAYWYVRAEDDYLNELSVSVLQEVSAKFEAEETEQNAAIVDVMQQN